MNALPYHFLVLKIVLEFGLERILLVVVDIEGVFCRNCIFIDTTSAEGWLIRHGLFPFRLCTVHVDD